MARPGFFSRLVSRLLAPDVDESTRRLMALGGVQARADLRATGLVSGEVAAVMISVQPKPEVRLFAFIIRLTSLHDRVLLRLLSSGGKDLEQVLCEPMPGSHEVVLFTTAIQDRYRLSAFSNARGRIEISFENVVAFSEEVLHPSKVMARRDPAPMPGWSDYYGPPPASDLPARFRAAAFSLVEKPASVRWLKDSDIWLEPGDEVSRILMLTGVYEPETLSIFESLLPVGGTFVDVGAHCGLYTIFAAAQVGLNGRVIAFEPSEREYRRLEKNVSLNKLTWVTLVKAAVVEFDGPVKLRIAHSANAGHNTIGSRFAYNIPLDHLAEVRGISLDAFVAENALERCDLIKMDIEGAELSALRGAASTIDRFKPVLILEVLEAALAAMEVTVSDLLAWLEEHGYTVYDIDPINASLRPAEFLQKGVGKNIVAIPSGHSKKG